MIVKGHTLQKDDVVVIGDYVKGVAHVRLVCHVWDVDHALNRLTFDVINGGWRGTWQDGNQWVEGYPDEAAPSALLLAWPAYTKGPISYDELFDKSHALLNVSRPRAALNYALALAYPYTRPFRHLQEALMASWRTFRSYYVKRKPYKPDHRERGEWNDSIS